MKLYPAPKKRKIHRTKSEWKTCDKNSQWKFYVNKKRSRKNIYRENRKCVRENTAFTVRRLTVDKRHDLYNFAKAHFDV